MTSTRKGPTLPPEWRGRGSATIAIEVSAFPQAESGAWLEVVRQMGFGLRQGLRVSYVEPAGPHSWEATFKATGPNDEMFSPFIVGHVHPVRTDPSRAHWSIEWRRRMGPDSAKDAEGKLEALGGYASWLAELKKLWPAKGPLAMDITATFVVNERRWQHNLAPKSPPAKKRRITAEGADWKIDPASGVVKNVTWRAMDRETSLLSVTGEIKAELREDLFPALDEESWRGLCGLLRKRPARRTS